MKSANSLIFHIDVNSAFLSFEAAYRLQKGCSLDLRNIPAVVGGDPSSRHGIVLAKSIPAKKYKIETGEPIYSAKIKCPKLYVVPPNFELYIMCSKAMVELFKTYTPLVEQFSIDECFLDFSNMENHYDDHILLANNIREHVKKELGFTVNIGISTNKLLAKVASDFKKPDLVHTLYPHEIKEKMWPCAVEDLFMVGKSTVKKLHNLNIFTIGDLANYDLKILKDVFKSHGETIWLFANGIENSKVKVLGKTSAKAMGNSRTIEFNVEDRSTAHKIILSLCETVAMRLRKSGNFASLVSISFRDYNFKTTLNKENYPLQLIPLIL